MKKIISLLILAVVFMSGCDIAEKVVFEGCVTIINQSGIYYCDSQEANCIFIGTLENLSGMKIEQECVFQ